MQINEWLPNPDGVDAGSEWVELFNDGAGAVNLKGWALQAGTGRKYILKDHAVGPGGYVVIGKSEAKVSLKNTDASISLYDASGVKRDTSSFAGSAPSGLSYSRNNDTFSFVAPTPGAKNTVLPAPSMSASIANNVPFSPHFSYLTLFFLAFAVAFVVAFTITLTVKKDETLSKLFFN